jgi:hypothetical protein
MAVFSLNFSRTFQHEDWVDNQDRVQAAGENGFNQRFHTLEADLDTMSDVVEQVETALNSLGTAPPAEELRATFTPTLVATSGSPWSHGVGFAQKPGGATAAQGMMSVSLPDGAVIRQFRAAGQNSGAGNLRITLLRGSATNPAAASDQIARVDGSDDPFDVGVLANALFERVDNTQFKYYVAVRLDNAAGADVVNVISFQVVYLTS